MCESEEKRENTENGFDWVSVGEARYSLYLYIYIHASFAHFDFHFCFVINNCWGHCPLGRKFRTLLGFRR